jgi:chorismate synthase
MLSRLRLITAGESHGPKLSAVLEGMPAGLRVDHDAIAALLARRQRGFGAGGRMKIERDVAIIHAGVADGRTSGGPIALEVHNKDWASWRGREIEAMTRLRRPAPRPRARVGARDGGPRRRRRHRPAAPRRARRPRRRPRPPHRRR